MMSTLLTLPRSFTPFLFLLILPRVFADPATVDFSDCFDQSANVTQKLNITTIYAQILPSDMWGHYLNLTLLGESSQGIINFSNTSSSLSTLFTTTSVLTLTAFTNTSALCSTLRPPSPLPSLSSNATGYCPLSPGPFAFSVTVPLGDRRELTTLSTRLRAVDPFTNELFCLDVPTTPLEPTFGSPYGEARIIFWVTVALTLGYWAVVGVARIISAWGRGIADKGLWARARSGGFILASAISGERLAGSPALMRFCTPSMRDILFHTQWCSALAMVAVEWPPFVYPILSQTAWSTLSYNVTLSASSGHGRWNPLTTRPFSPPQNFTDQLADPLSPLFVNASVPNLLFTLPDNATNGISSFAYTVGLRPEDLFANCLILFLGIIAATIVISTIVWCIDHATNLIFGSNNGSPYPGLHTVATPRTPVAKDTVDTTDLAMPTEETKSQNGHLASLFRPTSRFGLSTVSSAVDRSTYRSWWRFRSDINSFHGSVLHGNLVRILVFFHLPVTIFSCYHLTLPHSRAPMGSVVLAALSFAFFSVLIPVHLVLRVTFTSTNKLYDETRTLLNYGVLYNHYRHGSQMFASLLFATNLVFGVTIGTGQKSGTAQAIIILIVEVVSALVTSIWLPWGSGASMGLISFLFCVARIIMAVLLVILTPTISIGSGPAGWVAYGILIIMALVFLALSLMLLVKLLEGLIRVLARIGFDRSRHVTDSGLLGVLGFLGCCGLLSGSRKHHRTRDRRSLQQVNYRESGSSDLPPLNRHTTFDSIRSDIVHPPFLTEASRKASIHSGPPPSVLRPEHALLPYREDKDSDDEGFIMGAWRPFGSQRPGYSPVSDTSGSSSTNKQPSTGFSRVGGGRSHIDSPYSINHGGRGPSGSTHTFPSHSTTGPGRSGLSNPVFYDDDDSPPPSLSNVSNIPVSGVAAGESQSLHTRTKSQTAIVEDAGRLSQVVAESGSPPVMEGRPPSSGGTGVANFFRPRLSSIAAAMTGSGNTSSPSYARAAANSAGAVSPDLDDDVSDNQQHKKKPWQFLMRRRAQSNEDYASPPPVDPEFGGLDLASPSSQPGRSFVVIRKVQGAGRAPDLPASGEASGYKAATATF